MLHNSVTNQEFKMIEIKITKDLLETRKYGSDNSHDFFVTIAVKCRL